MVLQNIRYSTIYDQKRIGERNPEVRGLGEKLFRGRDEMDKRHEGEVCSLARDVCFPGEKLKS
jgi:hypothetical protein